METEVKVKRTNVKKNRRGHRHRKSCREDGVNGYEDCHQIKRS